jgi:small-conductance mechanosensitive channel
VAVIALIVAQLLYGLAVRGVRRTLEGKKSTFWRSLLMRTRGPGRMALILAALSWAVHAAPFPPRQASTIQHALGIAFIVLCGWVALSALDIGAALYMRRYRIDVTDNLLARKHLTQTRILTRAIGTLIVLVTLAMALMTIPGVRQVGVSLLAAGGAAGIIVGLALQPVLANLIAGVQIALTQPIRIDDAVIVEGEWGKVEEITATYVVIRIWDLRRLIVPLKYFMDTPFQNWTRQSAKLMGTALLYVDYRTPVAAVRAKLEEIVRASSVWDKDVVVLQVTDIRERTMELRCLMTAANSGELFDLRCEVREKMMAWLQQELPDALPRDRLEFGGPADRPQPDASRPGPAPRDQRVQ